MQLCDIINKMRKEKSVSNLNIINELENHKKEIDALKSEIKN